MARQRADFENVTSYSDSPELRELTDVDDHLRRNQTKVHRRQQTLAAGQQLRLPMHGKHFQRAVNAGWACVSESRGFHERDPPRPGLIVFQGLNGAGHQRSSLLVNYTGLKAGASETKLCGNPLA